MKEKSETRLDNYLINKKLFNSRTKAKQSIERGEVIINGKVITKPSFIIDEKLEFNIEINSPITFVSLGGYKLNKALNDFNFNVNRFICADVGCSTGGFTDCLIQKGAKKVYAIDLNNSLLDKKLKENKQVNLIVKNAKALNRLDFNDNLDLIVADLSFISLTSVIKVFYNLLDNNKYCILLIKPQFEVGERINFKNGIIKDEKYRIKACKEIFNCAIENGFSPLKITKAPIRKDKNIEYLILLKKCKNQNINFDIFIKNV